MASPTKGTVVDVNPFVEKIIEQTGMSPASLPKNYQPLNEGNVLETAKAVDILKTKDGRLILCASTRKEIADKVSGDDYQGHIEQLKDRLTVSESYVNEKNKFQGKESSYTAIIFKALGMLALVAGLVVGAIYLAPVIGVTVAASAYPWAAVGTLYAATKFTKSELIGKFAYARTAHKVVAEIKEKEKLIKQELEQMKKDIIQERAQWHAIIKEQSTKNIDKRIDDLEAELEDTDLRDRKIGTIDFAELIGHDIGQKFSVSGSEELVSHAKLRNRHMGKIKDRIAKALVSVREYSLNIQRMVEAHPYIMMSENRPLFEEYIGMTETQMEQNVSGLAAASGLAIGLEALRANPLLRARFPHAVTALSPIDDVSMSIASDRSAAFFRSKRRTFDISSEGNNDLDVVGNTRVREFADDSSASVSGQQTEDTAPLVEDSGSYEGSLASLDMEALFLPQTGVVNEAGTPGFDDETASAAASSRTGRSPDPLVRVAVDSVSLDDGSKE